MENIGVWSFRDEGRDRPSTRLEAPERGVKSQTSVSDFALKRSQSERFRKGGAFAEQKCVAKRSTLYFSPRGGDHLTVEGLRRPSRERASGRRSTIHDLRDAVTLTRTNVDSGDVLRSIETPSTFTVR